MRTWKWYVIYKKGKKGPVILGKVYVNLEGVDPESWRMEILVKKSNETRRICKTKGIHRYNVRVAWLPL